MANRVPLILNTSLNQIQELPTGDNLDLSNSGIHNAGVITATNFSGDGSQLTGVTAGNASGLTGTCLLYTSPSPRDLSTSRMPSSA